MIYISILLTFGFLPYSSISVYKHTTNFLNKHLQHAKDDIVDSFVDTEIFNINKNLSINDSLIIDFDTPHGLIIFKTGNNKAIADVTYRISSESENIKQIKIENKLISQETVAFFFGDTIGQISFRSKDQNTHFSAVKIVFPEACQKFYLQTKYDNFHVNSQSGKIDLISNFSLTEENALTCYYHDMDILPYIVSFKFSGSEDFVIFNGKITNSQSNQVEFTEKSILTFEDIYFSPKRVNPQNSFPKQKIKIVQDQHINMTIFSQISNNDDISNLINDIAFFKGYLPNEPHFINGRIESQNETQPDSYVTENKSRQTKVIIISALCIIIAFILCSAVSYCIRKRNYCNNIDIENNEERDTNDPEIIENEASSSIGHETCTDIENYNVNSFNDEFEDKGYINNEFDESYPQTFFQQSSIEYKAPSQSLLATVLDEDNAKL